MIDWDKIKELRQAYVDSTEAFKVVNKTYNDAQEPRQIAYAEMCDARKALETAMFADSTEQQESDTRDAVANVAAQKIKESIENAETT